MDIITKQKKNKMKMKLCNSYSVMNLIKVQMTMNMSTLVNNRN